MNSPALPRVLPLLLISALLLASTGCLSTKYKRSDATTAPVALNLTSSGAPASAETLHPIVATLQTVIVCRGPGSWKKEAFWDEYVVTLSNSSEEPVTVYAAAVVDGLDAWQYCGSNPWDLEQQGRANLKKFEHSGRDVVVGAGLGAAWVTTPALMYGALWTGNSAMLVASTATFFAVPALAIGTGVRTTMARRDIRHEFDQRRLALPLTLQPHEIRRGSLFFPVSPGPQQLLVRANSGDTKLAVAINLASLASLHLSTPANPVPAIAEAKPDAPRNSSGSSAVSGLVVASAPR